MSRCKKMSDKMGDKRRDKNNDRKNNMSHGDRQDRVMMRDEEEKKGAKWHGVSSGMKMWD